MSAPKVKVDCVANEYAGAHQQIVEVWDQTTRKGCLISFRVIHGDLIIEPYKADDGVIARVGGQDWTVPK